MWGLCSICGISVKYRKQHWNRDHGFSICARCAEQEAREHSVEYMEDMYGEEGINYPRCC